MIMNKFCITLLLVCGFSCAEARTTLRLVDSNATRETKALYSNLWKIQKRGFMFGPIVGNLVMRNGIKNNPVDVYYFRDIAGVTTGKYAGLLSTLVVNLRDGKAVSFVPAGKGFKNGDMIQELCGLIQRYL